MNAETLMQEAHRSLESIRSQAVQTLRRAFPDLYALSAKAFEAKVAGDLDHHIRLGEYLTEWSNRLGKSPVEALASGRCDEVLRELADRAGLDAGMLTPVDSDSDESMSRAGTGIADFHVAYCDYYATGEGRTVIVALGGSAEDAKRQYLQNAPEFFSQAYKVQGISGECTGVMMQIMKWIPQAVVDHIVSSPPGTASYYGVFYINRS